MSKNDPRKALGKGIHSLLPPRPAAAAATAHAPAASPIPAEGSVALVPIDKVKPNPNQPRREFEPGPMLELSQSILREGIIQPLIVRRTESGDYEIIAGERRWRAAGMAGLKQVPVITRAASDQKVLELAIIENVQREDLNPIELAQAFYRMGDELGLSHDQIGEKTGKDRATVTNTIRLLQLPDDIQALVSAKKLSPGHARALLKLSAPEAQRDVAERSVREGWSVRQVEDYTRPEKSASATGKKKPSPPVADPNVKAAIGELERALGTRVRIVEKDKEKGTIEIEYYSQDDLDRVYNLIVGA